MRRPWHLVWGNRAAKGSIFLIAADRVRVRCPQLQVIGINVNTDQQQVLVCGQVARGRQPEARSAQCLGAEPWLIGTAMVEVRPNGTIAVAGRIGLPDTFTLFDRCELNRRLTTKLPQIRFAFRDLQGRS